MMSSQGLFLCSEGLLNISPGQTIVKVLLRDHDAPAFMRGREVGDVQQVTGVVNPQTSNRPVPSKFGVLSVIGDQTRTGGSTLRTGNSPPIPAHPG
jgi:hypothetical protein